MAKSSPSWASPASASLASCTSSLTHRTQDWLVLEAGSVSYGKATSYLPVIDLLKAYFKVHDRETPSRDPRESDRQAADAGSGARADPACPAGPARRARRGRPWQRSIPRSAGSARSTPSSTSCSGRARVQPVLVVFEDLHWIDAETQALLDSLVESLPTGEAALARQLPARVPARLGAEDLPQPASARRAPARERGRAPERAPGRRPGAGAPQATAGQDAATPSSSRRASGRWWRRGRSPGSAAPIV